MLKMSWIFLVLVFVSEDAGVSVAGSVPVVSLVSLVVAIGGVGVAGVVTIAVAGVAGVVVARTQKGVAVIPVATEEVLALQKDDIYFNMREVIVTCNQYAIQF